VRGSNEKPSKRALSRGKSEIDEYVAELKSTESDNDDAPEPIQSKVGLSGIEEFRRLMAYVAHLRETVSEMQKSQISSPAKQAPNHSIKALIGFTGMIGVVVVFDLIARRLPRGR
jgi:hypothetical protein